MVKLLIVDDDETIVALLAAFFQDQGYQVQKAYSREEVLEVIKKSPPQLVFLDIQMGEVSGIDILKQIRAVDPAIKVIMVTALSDEDKMAEAKKYGASDYVTKPFDLEALNKEVVGKVHAQLYEDLRNAYNELRETMMGVVASFASVVQRLDPHYTHEHIERVVAYAKKVVDKLAERGIGLGNTSEEMFLSGVLLHDVGKIFTPREILHKKGGLNDEEWKIMRRHPVDGAEMLEKIGGLKEVARIIRYHQEKWDGTGYPQGLKGEEIPLGSRVAAVVDTFDAITHNRPYRKEKSVKEALEELRRCAGTQFDPMIVELMCEIWEKET
jgi:putative nucleotidyltransferase with HDIG domain